MDIGDDPMPSRTAETAETVTVFCQCSKERPFSMPSPLCTSGLFLVKRNVPPQLIQGLAQALAALPYNETPRGFMATFSAMTTGSGEMKATCHRWRAELAATIHAHAPAFASVGVRLVFEPEWGKTHKHILFNRLNEKWFGPAIHFIFNESRKAAFGAEFSAEAAPQQQMVIDVPAGTAPGAVLTVRAPDGRMVQVGIPNPAPPQLTIMF
jgi:hypothetical protein